MTHIEEDEIDLKELFATIMRYKKKIALFVVVITTLTLFYVITLPNVYQSQTILAPQKSSKSMGGGLSSLAAMAGVSLGGGGDGKDPYMLLSTTLEDALFNNGVIQKYDLVDRLNNPKNLVYAFGINFSDEDNDEKVSKEEAVYNARKKLKKIVSISDDKKTGLIVLKAQHIDRFLAKELVDIYLNELVKTIKLKDMKEIENQIKYYKKELAQTYDVSLKEQLSKSLSALMQKRVFSLANDYYFVSKLTEARVAYVKEKVKPKRALILIVSMITSLILAIFLVFFIEFLKSEDEQKIS